MAKKLLSEELVPALHNKIKAVDSKIPTVEQTTGNGEFAVMSQAATTKQLQDLDNKIPEVSQTTGSSVEAVMSQKAVTDNLNELDERVTAIEGGAVIPDIDVQQTTGDSTTAVMSQKAVSDELSKTNSAVATNAAAISSLNVQVGELDTLLAEFNDGKGV